MINTSILGTFGTMLGLVRAMPQLARLLRAKEAFGVSVDTAATSAICSFSWVVYGVLTHQFFFSLSSGLTGFIFSLITLQNSKDKPVRESGIKRLDKHTQIFRSANFKK
ncbi:MAG: hypothetical protein IT327_22995 [Anaerolineae bacterium]|nr:hypothetical protein [Anaerolineae bacterium]